MRHTIACHTHLSEGEEQGHVTADALLLEHLARSDALPCGRNLHTSAQSLHYNV